MAIYPALAIGLGVALYYHPRVREGYYRVRWECSDSLDERQSWYMRIMSTNPSGRQSKVYATRHCDWVLKNNTPDAIRKCIAESGCAEGWTEPLITRLGKSSDRVETLQLLSYLDQIGRTSNRLGMHGALRWLAKHQTADGYWETGHPEGERQGDVCAVTAFSLLAFMGAGNSEKFGRYKTPTGKALYWLLSQRDPKTGLVGTHSTTPICTVAITEGYGMGNVQKVGAAAQDLVDLGVRTQLPSGGWSDTPDGMVADPMTSTWWMMAFKSATVAGLRVPAETRQRAIAFIRGELAKSEDGVLAETGGALTCLRFHGVPRTDSTVARIADSYLAQLPSAGEKHFMRSYWRLLGMFTMGGQYRNRSCIATARNLYSTQLWEKAHGSRAGSWNPGSPGLERLGRAGETALACLMMEVVWRYMYVEQQAKSAQ